MKLSVVWLIGCDTPEWRDYAERAVRLYGLRARFVPSMTAVAHEPPNPLYAYLTESEDITGSLWTAVAVFRQWAAAGIGLPCILHIGSVDFWEQLGQAGEHALPQLPHPIYQIKLPKEAAFEDYDAPEAIFSVMRYFSEFVLPSEEVWYVPRLHFFSGAQSEDLLRSVGVSKLYLTYPHADVPKHAVLVLEESSVGELLMRAYDFVWQYYLWNRPCGLVALAPAGWHAELQRAQVNGRPLFLDICTPEQLQAEGAARVQQWRTQLQTELEAFYAEWAAKLPPPTHAP